MRYNPDTDLLLTALINGEIQGSIVIDGHQADSQGAHLRWFIVGEAFIGKGIGKRLLNEAVAFCQEKNYQKVYLWTFEGLDTARHLYEAAGFSLIKEQRGKQWGVEVNEQLFQWTAHEKMERLG